MTEGFLPQQNHLYLRQYNKIRPFFDDLVQKKDLSKNMMSSFWKGYLDNRHNFPTFNEIITFRRTMASGIGYGTNIDEKNELTGFLLDLQRAKCCTPVDFLKENQESNVGQPYQYFKDGILSSPAGLHNSVNAYHILQALTNLNINRTKHILEIGAGYGGVADILIRNIAPDIYMICDLPQNLFLSAYYLSVNYPKRELHFVNNSAPKKIVANSLVFCTPAGIELIKEKFDLIVNTYSFQEMTLSEVNRYFDYIAANITDDGLLYFLNTYGAAGAQKPTDYPFNLFEVKYWGPFAVPQPSFLHRKQHMEVVLQKGTDKSWPANFENVSHILSLLMFMGINLDIIDCCNRLIQGELSEADQKYLTELQEVVLCETPKVGLRRIKHLAKYKDWDHITHYISGLLSLFDNDHSAAISSLKKAIEGGLQGFAKSKAYVGLGLLSQQSNELSEAKTHIRLALENSPQFEAELRDWRRHISLVSFKNSYRFAFSKLNIYIKPTWKKIPKVLHKCFLKLRD